jgi:hypothetical protein
LIAQLGITLGQLLGQRLQLFPALGLLGGGASRLGNSSALKLTPRTRCGSRP